MDKKDLKYFDDYPEEYLEGDPSQKYQIDDLVYINDDPYTITEFVASKELGDSLGFPAVYSWYKANDKEGEGVNLFFYDDDIDSMEKNEKVAEKWWDEYNPTV